MFLLQVALTNSGSVFVADGYCNARVMEFSADGGYRGSFELPAPHRMQTPHSVAIDECGDALYVADREGSAVHMFSLSSRELKGVTAAFDLAVLSCKCSPTLYCPAAQSGRSLSCALLAPVISGASCIGSVLSFQKQGMFQQSSSLCML